MQARALPRKETGAWLTRDPCGNIDCPELGPGHTLYLPVRIPGGMVSLGDVHACMGDSEITGVAMETAADVHLRVDLVKAAGSSTCTARRSNRTGRSPLWDATSAGRWGKT